MSGRFAYLFQLLGAVKQVPYRGLVRQHAAHYSEDIECGPVQLAVVLDDGDKAVCDDRNINLYSHSVFGCPPEGKHPKMLLDPPKEAFHLPTLPVQQGDVFCLECEVVSQVRERPLKVWSIVNYSPQLGGILLPGLIAGKAYRLVKKYIILAVQQVLSFSHLVVESGLLSDDKVGVDEVNLKQPCKVEVSLVEDVKRKRLIRNVIHRIHVMDFGLRNMNVGRYLGHHVKQRVDFDSAFGLPEVSPLEQAQTEVDGGGVKGIELPMQHELPINPLALGKLDHVESELLEDPVIPVGIGVSDVAQLDAPVPKTEMEALILDALDDANHLPKAVTARMLAVHHHQKLVPTRERLHVLVALVLVYDAIKCSLRQKNDELTEYVLSAAHVNRDYIPATKFGNPILIDTHHLCL